MSVVSSASTTASTTSASTPGLGLLEVVVALAVLSVATLGIAVVVDAGSRRARAAEAGRRALELATAAAETAGRNGTVGEPVGWRRVDPPADEGGPPCWRRVVRADDSTATWLWIEATCGPEEPGASGSEGGRATGLGAGWAGGRLARSVILVAGY